MLKKYEVVDCQCGRVGNELEPDPTGPWMLAADVEQVFGEVEETLEVLINLIPDIGKLSKVQALLAVLKEPR